MRRRFKSYTAKELALYLLKEQHNHPSLTLYAEYDEKADEAQWAYQIAVINFADANMVIGNYWGGGQPFGYDLADDECGSGLESAIEDWFQYAVESDVVWVETNVDFIDREH